MNQPAPDHRRPAFLQSFDDLPDPRLASRCAYPLQEMLLVALCAISSDADDWVHVAQWGELKLDWLRRFLPFTGGIASHCWLRGSGWRGFPHHASLGIAAYGFLMEQQLRHPESAGKKTLHEAKNLPYPRITSLAAAPRAQRHVPWSITSLRLRIAAALLRMLPRCPCCLRVNARLRL